MTKPTYLVTKGTIPLLVNRYGLQLPYESQRRIECLEDEFTNQLGEELSSDFDFQSLTPKEIEAPTLDLVESSHLPKICLDDVYFRSLVPQGTISVTRLIEDINNFDNKVLGPRNGAPCLDEQVRLLRDRFSGQDVALVDIGIFAGETLISQEGIIPLLKKADIRVAEIYVGILNQQAREKLKGHDFDLYAGRKYDFTNGDWLELRDLLGLDGRKISRHSYQLDGGANLFARYTQDATTLKIGASISDPVTANIVLNLCHMYQQKILREIRRAGVDVHEGWINSDQRLYTLEFKKRAV